MSEATTLTQIRCEKTNSWSLAKILYTALMMFNLLSFLWLLANKAEMEDISPIIWITRLFTVPLSFYLNNLWKDKGFWILHIFFLFIFFRCFIPNPANIFQYEAAESILSALWLFTACYGLCRIYDNRQLKTFLLICGSIWTAGITILCCIGIYVAWTGQTIKLLRMAQVQLSIDSRLDLGYLATIAGSFTGMTILIASISAICTNKKIGKILFILSLPPQILTLALTDARTAFISTSFGFGIIAFALVHHFFQNRRTQINNRKNNYKAWLAGIFVMFAVFGVVLWGFMHITPVFNQIKMKGIIARAYAETEQAETTIISSRGFTGHLLSGRSELWERTFRHFQKKPLTLLIGESVIAPRSFDYYYAHSHNLCIQVLLESGIPGLLLILSFAIYILIKSIRVIRTPCIPLWIRLLPAIPAALWVGDLTECFLWLRSSQTPMAAIFFISAGIIVSRDRKESRTMICPNRG